MKLPSILSSLIATSLLMASIHPVEAQKKRPAGVSSLAEMSCQNLKGEYDAKNEDISVGLEIFRAVGVLLNDSGFTGGAIVQNRGVAQVVCRLAQPKEKPKYKTLTLAFGLSDRSKHSSESLVRLTLYKDGQEYGYKDISKGEKMLWQVDITGTRSIALEAECLRGPEVYMSSPGCAGLWFFEDTLK